MEKMNPEVKAAWVKALRSGEYSQGTGQLRSAEEKYCCLGVLCDIAPVGEWGGEAYIAGPDDWASAFLPRRVADWAGLSSTNPAIGGTGGELSYKNDRGATFAQIADLIEKNF